MVARGVAVALGGWWLICLASWARAADEAVPAAWRVDVNDQGVAVAEGGRPVLFYQRAPKSLDGRYERAGYVHPLYDLDGNVLSEDFPEDHRHHRGVFWAWHQVWVGQQRVGDPWSIRDFTWDVRTVSAETSGEAVTLNAEVLWRSPLWRDEQGEAIALVRETTRIRVHPAASDARKLDFQIELRALVDELRLGGSEDDKGYGGFSVRVRLPPDIQFRAETGLVEPRTESIAAGPWLEMTGTFAGQQPGGVTILCHPSLPGFPQPWILRRSRSMQNAAWPGREAVPLPLDSPLVLRYRLILHRGSATPAQLAAWQAEYQ